METNNKNFVSLGAAIGKTAGLVATTIVFAVAVFLAVFLFASRADSQTIDKSVPGYNKGYITPSEACKYYSTLGGVDIIKNEQNQCKVRYIVANRIGDMTEPGFRYTYYFYSGNKLCVETSGYGLPSPVTECKIISQADIAQQKQGNPGKIVSTFRIKELQFDTLPSGKPVQSGDNELIEITMPDGSLIQMDANSTFTPVSDHEVQSVFGRYRYLWQPFHDGKCIVGQNLVRQNCRKVKTRDAILGIRGTEFLVETDKSGTSITVLEGLLGVADLSGKKTVEVAGGQSTYIKHGGLPEDPKPFDSAKIERWWEKKVPAQTNQETMNLIIGGGVILFIIILFAKRKQIFQSRKKEKQVLAAADDTKSAPVQPKRAKIMQLIPAILILGVIVIYMLFKMGYIALPKIVLDFLKK